MEKITKKMVYEAAIEFFTNSDIATIKDIPIDTIIETFQKDIAALNKKAESAKKRAAEKKAEGDELRGEVEAVLTNEPQVIDDIVAQVNGEDVTKSKIVSRLAQLAKAGIAVKEMIKLEGGRKVAAYRLAGEEDNEPAETETNAE